MILLAVVRWFLAICVACIDATRVAHVRGGVTLASAEDLYKVVNTTLDLAEESTGVEKALPTPPKQLPSFKAVEQLRRLVGNGSNLGATGAAKAAAIEKAAEEWSDGWRCPTGVDIKFVKIGSVGSLASSFEADVRNRFRSSRTALAFDLDGTSNVIEKFNDAVEELARKKMSSRPGWSLDDWAEFDDWDRMEKVIITARSKSEKAGCDTVLQHLNQEASGKIQQLFGLPTTCPEEMIQVTNSNGIASLRADRMRATKGLIMNEYSKAEGLVTYLRAGFNSTPDAPEHVVFYDDSVKDVQNFASHFCRYDAWPELKQVTVVWYATPEAELKARTIEARIREGVVSADSTLQSSYFSPEPFADARLAGFRSLFSKSAMNPVMRSYGTFGLAPVHIGVVGKFARGSCCSSGGKRTWLYTLQPRTLQYYKKYDPKKYKPPKDTFKLLPTTQFWYSTDMNKSFFGILAPSLNKDLFQAGALDYIHPFDTPEHSMRKITPKVCRDWSASRFFSAAMTFLLLSTPGVDGADEQFLGFYANSDKAGQKAMHKLAFLAACNPSVSKLVKASTPSAEQTVPRWMFDLDHSLPDVD